MTIFSISEVCFSLLYFSVPEESHLYATELGSGTKKNHSNDKQEKCEQQNLHSGHDRNPMVVLSPCS